MNCLDVSFGKVADINSNEFYYLDKSPLEFKSTTFLLKIALEQALDGRDRVADSI